ncbi:MAG: hypothetical protein PWP23_1173 [Candidatus Sumerlaeota bacterium]|nr:hypothetical protein [Candidatus Sumerlaeota bacterium]
MLPLDDLLHADTPRPATLVVCDLEESTLRGNRAGSAAWRNLSIELERRVREQLHLAGGIEIDKTDGWLCLFPAGALEAIRFCMEAHRELARLSAEFSSDLEGNPLRLRAAVHHGMVMLRRNPAEHVARGAKAVELDSPADKPLAGRLMALALGGQTLVSGATAELLLPNWGYLAHFEAMQAVLHGTWEFKGVVDHEGRPRTIDVWEFGLRGEAPFERPPDSEKARLLLLPDGQPPPPWLPAADQIVPGRHYRLRSLLGKGGYGEVWHAVDERIGGEFAIKFCTDRLRQRALLRDAKLLGAAQKELGFREDIVRITDHNLEADPSFIVYEYDASRDLAAWADSLPGGFASLTLEARVDLVRQAAEAVGAAQAVGIHHRDIKPGNILVRQGAGGRLLIRLTDFGAGTLNDPAILERHGLTTGGVTSLKNLGPTPSASGTHGYRAPEVALPPRPTPSVGEDGVPDLDDFHARADVYSLGVVLFQAAAADFNQPHHPQVLEKYVADPGLRALIDRCTRFDPQERPANGAAVAAELSAWRASDTPLPVAPPPPAGHSRRRVPLLLVALLGGGTLLLLLCGGAAGLTHLMRGTNEGATPREAPVSGLSTPARGQLRMVREDAIRVVASGSNRDINAVAVSGDGRFGLTGTPDGKVRYWDLQSGRLKEEFSGHALSVTAVAFDSTGSFALSASHDKTARIWDLRNASLVGVLEGHEERVTDVAFSPDGRHILTMSRGDGTVRVWDAVLHNLRFPPWRDTAGKGVVPNFSANGAVLRLFLRGGNIVYLDPFTGRELPAADAANLVYRDPTYSADGLLGILITDGALTLVDMASGNILSAVNPDNASSYTVACLSADGGTVLAGQENGTLIVYSVRE